MNGYAATSQPAVGHLTLPIVRSGLLVAAFLASTAGAAPQQLRCDLLIVGGTESGWAAGIQAARLGVEDIVIVHDGEWLGGQFTGTGARLP